MAACMAACKGCGDAMWRVQRRGRVCAKDAVCVWRARVACGLRRVACGGWPLACGVRRAACGVRH
eukprot:1067564-Prymnesium_polylepis.1